METIDYWRLCEELTIEEAGNLIIGAIPLKQKSIRKVILEASSGVFVEDKTKYDLELHAILTALVGAIENGKLNARINNKKVFNFDEQERRFLKDNISIYETKITVADLKDWLISKNLKPDFFFPNNDNEPDYLDRNNEFYAPKLATAVRAWQAVTSDKSLLKTKTPKQAVEIWLKKNAKDLGLIDDEGNHIKQAIEEICKIVNWKPKGGATKTPE